MAAIVVYVSCRSIWLNPHYYFSTETASEGRMLVPSSIPHLLAGIQRLVVVTTAHSPHGKKRY